MAKKSETTKAVAEKKVAQAKKGGISKYFRDLRAELKKVTWPTKKQVVNNTMVVLATVCVTGLFLAGVDTGVAAFVKWLINIGA